MSAQGMQATKKPLTPEERLDREKYRQYLIDAEQKGQESFDKTLLTLGGGALGISFVFVKDIIGPNTIAQPLLLLAAWVLWTTSTLAVLSSFFFSNRALRETVKQCDSDDLCDAPGGMYARLNRWCNVGGILFFVAGIAFMAAFVYLNLLQRGIAHGSEANRSDIPVPPAITTPDSRSGPTVPTRP